LIRWKRLFSVRPFPRFPDGHRLTWSIFFGSLNTEGSTLTTSQKVRIALFPSFPRKRESSNFKNAWIPDHVSDDATGPFTIPSTSGFQPGILDLIILRAALTQRAAVLIARIMEYFNAPAEARAMPRGGAAIRTTGDF
jgi:hypothetical protein